MKQHLSKSDIKRINADLLVDGFVISKRDKVEVMDRKYLLINDRLCFFEHNNIWVPTLKLLSEENLDLPSVEVDEGTIPHVVKGADIMRPGIVEIQDGIRKGDVVVVRDSVHKKPIAIGIALTA
ncbi:DUF1947 domain-containing protein, partial [Candidatus Woesearchaeota archaeon]|nr:DUF1947 domain-containing protein [Candidatus Woesearchaeota archaeon]